MGLFIENYQTRRITTCIFYLTLLELFTIPFSYEISTVSLLLGCILYIYKGIKYGFRWQWDIIDIFIGVFAFFALLSVWVAPDKSFSFYNFWNLVGRYLLTYYLVVQNYNSWDCNATEKIIGVLLISLLIVLVYGIVQGVFGLGMQEQGVWVDSNTFSGLNSRVYSTWYNPNLLGGYLDICLGILVGLYVKCKNKSYKIILALLFLFALIVLSMTYARGAIIAIFIALGMYTGIKQRKLFLILVIILGLIFVFNPVLLDRLLLTTQKLDTSSEMRLAFWSSTWAMIKNHPLLGIGWGQFYMVYPQYDYYMQGHYIKIVHAHNLFLNIWAEIGLFGLFGYVTTFALGIYRGLTYKVKGYLTESGLSLGIGLGFLAMAINGLTDYVLFNVELSMFMWYLLAVITVINRRERH